MVSEAHGICSTCLDTFARDDLPSGAISVDRDTQSRHRRRTDGAAAVRSSCTSDLEHHMALFQACHLPIGSGPPHRVLPNFSCHFPLAATTGVAADSASGTSSTVSWRVATVLRAAAES